MKLNWTIEMQWLWFPDSMNRWPWLIKAPVCISQFIDDSNATPWFTYSWEWNRTLTTQNDTIDNYAVINQDYIVSDGDFKVMEVEILSWASTIKSIQLAVEYFVLPNEIPSIAASYLSLWGTWLRALNRNDGLVATTLDSWYIPSDWDIFWIAVKHTTWEIYTYVDDWVTPVTYHTTWNTYTWPLDLQGRLWVRTNNTTDIVSLRANVQASNITWTYVAWAKDFCWTDI